MTDAKRAAVIGLGEVGGRYAAALVDAGYAVKAYDPGPVATPHGVHRADEAGEAVVDAEIVLVVTAAKAARVVAETCSAALQPGTCYADFTSSSPSAMVEISRLIEDRGAAFCDVAILGPVSWYGAGTPLMIAGRGAARVAALAAEFGTPAEIVDGPPGAAMAHKLLRSVVMKGFAAVVDEAVSAGSAAGYEDWIRDQIAAQLAGDGHAVIDRFLSGSRTHAERRAQEMQDTAHYLTELGVSSDMSAAAATALRRLAADHPSARTA